VQPTASPGGAEGGAPGVHLDRHHLTALGANDDTRAAVGQERAGQSKADDEEHTEPHENGDPDGQLNGGGHGVALVSYRYAKETSKARDTYARVASQRV
jgi:hypothetical protein